MSCYTKLVLFILALHCQLAGVLSLLAGCLRTEADIRYQPILIITAVGFILVTGIGIVGVFPKTVKEVT